MQPPTMDRVHALLVAAWATGDDVAASQWAAWVDAHDPAREARTASLAGAALWYAQQGLHVFPLQPKSKEPYRGSRGCKDATSDPTQVGRWWQARPASNIGLATGHLVDVIDVDGLQGNLSLSRARAEYGADFPVPRLRLGHVLTPRPGGRHYYTPAGGGGNKAGWLPGIDYRGRGGYVVAPPSVTDAGTYRWLQPLRLP